MQESELLQKKEEYIDPIEKVKILCIFHSVKPLENNSTLKEEVYLYYSLVNMSTGEIINSNTFYCESESINEVGKSINYLLEYLLKEERTRIDMVISFLPHNIYMLSELLKVASNEYITFRSNGIVVYN